MTRSIRGRLQTWYALVLTAVVAGFAAILYTAVGQARLREMDAELEAAANYLDAALRVLPPHDLTGDKGDFPPKDGPGPSKLPPPGLPPRERLLESLVPPQGPFSDADPHAGYFCIWRADGSLLKSGGALPDPPPALPEQTQPLPAFRRRAEYQEVTRLGPHRTCVLVGRSTAKAATDQAAFAWQLAGAGGAVLLVGLAGGWLISSRILRPIAAISVAASRLSATNLSERIPTTGIDRELLDLARVLNETFDRLHAAFDQLTRFTADASHELRTPLAVIRSHAQLALSRPRSAEEYRQAIETCLQATTRMTTIVEGLLTLARADAGKLGLRKETLCFDRIVTEATDLVRPLAEARDIIIRTEVQPVTLSADREALTRITSNLLDNAVKYNRPGGLVRVELGIASDEAVLSVADTGPGIPAADRSHIFERFFRVDRARSRASGGTGLGLAICRSLTEAHGGRIECESRENEGSTFRVRLPRK